MEKREKKIQFTTQFRYAIEKIERHIDERYGYLVALKSKEGGRMPTSAELLDTCWKTIKLNY